MPEEKFLAENGLTPQRTGSAGVLLYAIFLKINVFYHLAFEQCRFFINGKFSSALCGVLCCPMPYKGMVLYQTGL